MLTNLRVAIIGMAIMLTEFARGSITQMRQANVSACEQLVRNFPNKTFTPGSADYLQRSDNDIWAGPCILKPACVFVPFDEHDVSAVLRIIHSTQTVFSVASGGHMPVPGAQSNNGGVMITMSRFTRKEFNSNRSIASIGPGNRWVDVYSWTSPYGLAVAGGRYSTVGVGGLLVSGGINYFAKRYGFSVNTVVSMQVVLGNGTIVEASEATNPDLFWALKGGSNNFGIVTRYDMITIPVAAAYGGVVAWQGFGATTKLIEATQSFLESPQGIDDIFTEIAPNFSVIPGQNGVVWQPLVIPFVVGNYSTAPQSLVNITSIPDPIVSTLGHEDSWVNVPIKIQNADKGDINGNGQAFGCVSTRIAPGIIQLVVDTVLRPAVQQLANITNAVVNVSPEIVTQSQLRAAKNAGEYAIDLEPEDGSFIILLVSMSWSKSSDDETAFAFMRNILPKLKEVLVERDLYYDFIYLGDAAPGQYPYSTYGKGASLPRMKMIQAAYDPLGLFRNLITSGFKL